MNRIHTNPLGTHNSSRGMGRLRLNGLNTALTTLLVCSVLPATLQAQTQPTPPASPTPVVSDEYDAVGNPTKTVVAPECSRVEPDHQHHLRQPVPP